MLSEQRAAAELEALELEDAASKHSNDSKDELADRLAMIGLSKETQEMEQSAGGIAHPAGTSEYHPELDIGRSETAILAPLGRSSSSSSQLHRRG